MTTEQVYTILNETASQALGKEAISVVDTASFVALGNAVLSSDKNTEPFFNTLLQRLGMSVLVNRAYRSRFRPLIKGEMERGTILQKISVDMPEVSEDDSLGIVNGNPPDQYEVKKPTVKQWLFVKDVTYSIFITLQERWLRQAFLSPGEMGRFIALVFQKVQNKLELCIENLCRAAMNNYAVICNDAQVVNLVTMYNTESGKTIPTGMSAMFDEDFLKWSSGTIREIGRDMEGISVLYNQLGEERHSPMETQNLALLSKFHTQLETVAYASAFNVDYLRLVENYTVPFWQASGTSLLDYETKSKIIGTNQAGETVTRENVIGMMFDNDALGAFRKWQSTHTTPIHARCLHTNTFWHEDQMWFNALDENYLLLTLN